MSACFGYIKHSTFCIVQLLDGTELRFPIRRTDNGSILIDKVLGYLDVYDREYFGLRVFNTTNGASFWLDAQKKTLKQLKGYGVQEKKPKLYFGVKFYMPEPSKLKEGVTRYLFFMQLRSDVCSGRIPLSFDVQAELGAIVTQAELGNYDPDKHFEYYMDNLKVTKSTMSRELEQEICYLHKTRYRGLSPARCETLFLELVSKQELYGVQLFTVKGLENKELYLGVSPEGLLIYEGRQRVNLYTWGEQESLDFKDNVFELKLLTDKNSKAGKTYKCHTTIECKHLWKLCVEYHSFFQSSSKNRKLDMVTHSLLGSQVRSSIRSLKDFASDRCTRDLPQTSRNFAKLETSPLTNKDIAQSVQADREANGHNNHQTPNGLFSQGQSSPSSLKSFRMKFSSNTQEFNKSRRNSARSNRTITSAGHSCSVTEANKQLNHLNSRILNGNSTPALPSHSRQSAEKAEVKPYKLYENLTYDANGMLRLDNYQKHYNFDARVLEYQSTWLEHRRPAASGHSTDTNFNDGTQRSENNGSINAVMGFYRQYPVYKAYTNHQQGHGQSSLNHAFPHKADEEKHANRDSGTDSPTCYSAADHSSFTYMKAHC